MQLTAGASGHDNLLHDSAGSTVHDGESHRAGRIGWLRAAVLGANDRRLISTSSLVVGVAAAQSARDPVLLLVAGCIALVDRYFGVVA